jgi:peptide-methionine (R)-S-oxide reductase
MFLGTAGCGDESTTRVSSTNTTQPAGDASAEENGGAAAAIASPDEPVLDEPTEAAESVEADASQEEPKPVKEKVVRTEEEWKKILTPQQYYVLRQKGTERPFQNKYDHHFQAGTYACAACGQELFDSDTKFNSGCGWPAFYAAQAGDRVTLTPDNSLGMIRTEVTCSRCDSHLGHIFDDAPQTPTGQRYCINSVSLKFIPAAESEPKAAEGDESEE